MKKYTFQYEMTMESFEKLTVEKAKVSDIFLTCRKGRLYAVKSKALFDLIPIRGQCGFDGDYRAVGDKVVLTGRFGPPFGFRVLWCAICGFFILAYIRISIQNGNAPLETLPSVAFICAGLALISWIGLLVGTKSFSRENETVLCFLENMSP